MSSWKYDITTIMLRNKDSENNKLPKNVSSPSTAARPVCRRGGDGAGMEMKDGDDIDGLITEADPLYRPLPDAYYRRVHPLRVTR